MQLFVCLFQVFYLPKNTTSKIQPLDQGIISTTKANYKKELMRAIFAEGAEMTDYISRLSIKDAFYLLEKAWGAVEPKSIKATWNKALGNPFDHPEVHQKNQTPITLLHVCP